MCKAKNLGKQRDETLQTLPQLGGGHVVFEVFVLQVRVR